MLIRPIQHLHSLEVNERIRDSINNDSPSPVRPVTPVRDTHDPTHTPMTPMSDDDDEEKQDSWGIGPNSEQTRMWQKGPDVDVLSSPDQSLTCKNFLCGLWCDSVSLYDIISRLFPVEILVYHLLSWYMCLFIMLIFEQYRLLMGKHTSCWQRDKP